MSEKDYIWLFLLVITLMVLGLIFFSGKTQRKQKLKSRHHSLLEELSTYPPVVTMNNNNNSHASNYRGRRPVILLVDDSPTVLKTTTALLEEKQYRVITAENGKKAWSILQDGQKPDAIITDIDMPMLNGFGLLKLIRSDLKLADLPVIMMTGKVYYHIQAGHEEGLNGLLSKPFRSEDLYEQIRFVLQE
jgi:CheY-like chemotaxis protein